MSGSSWVWSKGEPIHLRPSCIHAENSRVIAESATMRSRDSRVYLGGELKWSKDSWIYPARKLEADRSKQSRRTQERAPWIGARSDEPERRYWRSSARRGVGRVSPRVGA